MARGAVEIWYASWGDARAAYLVDLIRRPGESLVRVAVFRRGQAARVLRQHFAREALVADAHATGATLGSWRLDGSGCAGQIEDVALDCRYRLLPPEVTMVPAWVARISAAVPALRSTPGTLIEGQGGSEPPEAAVPCVFTRYRVGDIARAKWFLITAQAFENSQARCEISGGWFGGRWAVTGYLRLGDRLLPLNHPIANLRRFRALASGALVGASRRFEVTYQSRGLSLRLTAEAPAEAFVVLEREGPTTIHTTLFGSCTMDLTIDGTQHQLIARDRCLLEVKS
jgi:hypothetical protein